MEQKQVRSQFSHETMEELRKRVLDLEEQNRVLDAFIENSTDAIQISDRNLVTLRINRAYEVLTGIRREELVGVSGGAGGAVGEKPSDFRILRCYRSKDQKATHHCADLLSHRAQCTCVLHAGI